MLIIYLLSLVGCQLVYLESGKAVKYPFYSVSTVYYVKNGVEITSSEVDFDHIPTAEGRLLPPAGQAAFEPGPDPIPEHAHVFWKLADGRALEADPEVAKYVHHPRSFSGTIQFRLYDDKVRVVVLTKEDMDHYHLYEKNWVPPDLKDDEGFAPAHPATPSATSKGTKK